MSRLQQYYRETVVPQLQEKLGLSNPMEVPRIEKITVNMGVGETVRDRKILDHALGDMTKITGQKPLVCNARRSVASFKIRDGWPVGCKVTLRRERMFEFLGLSAKSFDGRGNYNMGVREQIIFPEVDYDQIDELRGMNITITTSARNDEQGQALLEAFDFPFRK